MDKNVDIFFKINGVDASIKDINDLAKAFDNTGEAAKDAAKDVKEAADEAENAGEQTGFLEDRYNDLKDTVGKLRADFKNATKGIKTFFTTGTTGAKALKIAFASTGIGLLVVAIASLVDYFKDTEEGSRVLTVAFESVGVIVNKLIDFFAEIPGKIISVFEDPVESIKGFADTIQTFVSDKISQLLEGFGLLGEALVDLFSGEFSSAAEKAKDGFLKIGDSALALNPVTAGLYQLGDVIVNDVVPAVTEAVNSVNDLVIAERALRDLNQELIIDNANLNKQLETQQKVAEDTTLTYEERKAALDEVNDAQIQLAENAALQAQAEEDVLRKQLELADSYEEREELQTALAEAVANRIDRETELETKKLDADRLSRELEQEELDRQRGIQDMIQQLRLENVQDEEQAALEGLRIAEEAAMRELENLNATEEEKAQLRAEFETRRQQIEDEFRAEREAAAEEERQKQADADKKAADDAIALEKAVAQSKLQVSADAFSALAQIAGEQSAVGKAAAVAAATINTYQAATNALANTPAPPPFPQIAAGVAIASGLVQVRKILKTKTPGPSGGGGGGGGNVPTIPSIPTFNPEQALASNNQSLTGLQNPGAAVTPGGESTPVRAYVVATEVTSAQEANQQIDNLARL